MCVAGKTPSPTPAPIPSLEVYEIEERITLDERKATAAMTYRESHTTGVRWKQLDFASEGWRLRE